MNSIRNAFPEVVSFIFKKTDDGTDVKLSFHSHMKMDEFVRHVIEKSYLAFNIPHNKDIEVIETSTQNEAGEALDPNDTIMLRDKYANNYKYVAFYIRVN